MNAVDLFAGCGGLSLGFQNAGFHVVAAFEYWDIAVKCYRQNFSHPVYQMDLSNTEKAIEAVKNCKPDLIIGGPPCQDFSHAGKRIEAGRAELTEVYAQIVDAVRPKYFVMENVDRAQGSHAFHVAKEIFQRAGYGLTQIVLDASRCGAPQKRKRFFCIGILGAKDNVVLPYLLQNMSEKEMTLRDYFGDTLGFQYYYRHPRNYNRRAIFSIDEPAPTMRGVNRPVPKGYPGHPKDACKINENIRALTTLERALIQTFPPNFKWCGNKTEQEQMIGNAVPVKLGEFVANALKMAIEGASILGADEDVFKKWLLTEKKYSARTVRDVISRIKRADKIFSMGQIPDMNYLYQLQQIEAYCDLSTAVKSQLKRSVILYYEFLHKDNSVSL